MSDAEHYVLPTAAPEGIDFRVMARAIGTVLRYSAGNVIFREGDPPRYMYVVLTGGVDIVTQNKTIEQIGAGDAFGIISLLDDKPRSAGAIAREDSEVAFVDAKKFRYMIEETPSFVWYVLGGLVRRVRATNAAL